VALNGWIVDKSAAARADEPAVAAQFAELAGQLYVCGMGELEQLYSARSAAHYDALRERLHMRLRTVPAPHDIFERALRVQRDLAHHHGMWHRTPIPDLIIAETALYHGLGIVHADRDYERIAEVRPLRVRRLG
jgi:predicted nucleic acid-binding protein